LSFARSDFLKSLSLRLLLMTDAELTEFFGASFVAAIAEPPSATQSASRATTIAGDGRLGRQVFIVVRTSRWWTCRDEPEAQRRPRQCQLGLR
jgi:hypothetical protein